MESGILARRLLPLIVLAVGVLAFGLPASAGIQRADLLTTPLHGVVGPGSTITLTRQDGTSVTHLDPGTYAIVVEDKSDAHNFHLSGAGVDQQTPVDGMLTTTWEVTFQDGKTYKFQCDAHPGFMRGSFTVGTVQPPPVVPRLNARVTSRTISLKTAGGVRVGTLPEGNYRIVVNDATKAQNFHLKGPGVNRKTRVRAKATVTWKLRLDPGKFVYRSDQSTRLRRTFTVKSTPPPAALPAAATAPQSPGPRLNARVTPRTISLTNAAGVRVSSIRQSTYMITVSDSTRAQNFHLIGPGISRKTRVAATAMTTWSIALTPGRYVYRSDRNRKLRGSFTVTSVPPA